jgi:tetratricopeptide (TPR) repeat protein
MTQTDSLFAQALAHHEAGRGNDAEPLYLAVLAESPTHPHALHNLGQLWLGRGEPARALSYLRRALELVPEDGLFWVSCLEALLHDERYPEASELLARGRAQGLAGEVVEQLAQALDFARDLPRHDAAIVACFQQGDDLQLAECARAVLAQCPGHGFAWKALGVALIRLGQFSEAMQALDMAQRRLPDDASVFNSLTNVLNSLGRHEEAEVAGRRALALQADYPQALVNLGNALRGMACLEEAERYYRQAMRTPACQIEAGNNLGIVLEEQGRLDEAESCLRDVLEHDPDYAPAWNHLGCVLDEQGRHEAALQAFQRCLSLDPDNVMAYNNLACTLKS